jgi:hypothetical protein
MSFRAAAEQLRTARRIANLRDDAEQAEVLAFIARMRAETEAFIAASRPSIQPRLRELQAEFEADYAEERAHGWAAS